MAVRKIIKIDKEKCIGCGACAVKCAEGAIEIIDGKAEVVKDSFCDGLGACIGECPRGALTIEEREADDFDAAAVSAHAASGKTAAAKPHADSGKKPAAPKVQEHGQDRLPCGCPGSSARDLRAGCPAKAVAKDAEAAEAAPSLLGNWPVQIKLVPVNAPYFDGARLLISADCVPFAFAGFHEKFLDGRVVMIGCPKLDDADSYRSKLVQVFRQNDIRGVEVLYMEVPCCFGLVRLVQDALEASGKNIPLILTKIGIQGEVCGEETLNL
jgi:Pyruvate/2-oxoacid:ferredoxin oxidoreductase delta subunit